MGNLRSALMSTTVRAAKGNAAPATNAVASTVRQSPAVTIDLIMEAMKRVQAISHGALIGDWLGCEVYVDPLVSPGEIIVRDPATDEVKMRFSVDHPTIQGTKMERAARRFLSPIPASPRA